MAVVVLLPLLELQVQYVLMGLVDCRVPFLLAAKAAGRAVLIPIRQDVSGAMGACVAEVAPEVELGPALAASAVRAALDAFIFWRIRSDLWLEQS